MELQFSVWTLYASYYTRTGKLDQAIRYLNEIEKKEIYSRNDKSLQYFLMLKSRYYRALGKTEKAVVLAKQSYKINVDSDYLVDTAAQEKYLSELHKEQKKYKEANGYLLAHLKLKDSLYSLSKSNSFLYLQTLYETKKKENEINSQKSEIKLLEQKNLLKERNLIIAVLISIGITLLLIFSILYYRLRSKSLKRRSKLRELKLQNQRMYVEKLEQEKEITTLELEIKQKELTTNSISLLQTKEQHTTLIKNLEGLKSCVNNKLGFELINEIISDCKSSHLSFNWETFKITFEKVHANFYSRLLAVHPDLSSNEKKDLCFFKIGDEYQRYCFNYK